MRKRAGLLYIAAILLAGMGSWADLSAQVRQVQSAQEVVDAWSPEVSLYIRGQVGIGQDQAEELGKWLRSHPNWTVFLTDKAEDERYTDADARSYRGYEAVEHHLGKELTNRTAFSSRTDARTGKSNGAILYISFDRNPRHRKIGYFALKHFDDLGLGESAWQGKLDRLAMGPLKNGRRVLDAVRAPIQHIESEATKHIEAAGRQAEALRGKAEGAIEQAAVSLDLLEQRLDEFRRENPAASRSAIANPELQEPVRLLDAARSLLDDGQPRQAISRSGDVSGWVQASTTALDLYPADGAAFDRHLAEVRDLAEDPEGKTLRPQLSDLTLGIERARGRWRSGDPTYSEELKSLETTVVELRELVRQLLPAARARLARLDLATAELEANSRADLVRSSLDRIGALLQNSRRALDAGEISPDIKTAASSLRLAGAEIARLEAVARSRFHSRLTLGVLAGFLFFGLLAFLNVRARRAYRPARELYDRWDSLLTEKAARLLELEQRKSSLLGDRGAASPFTGVTESTAQVARRLIGELFIMLHLARRHHASARLFIEPPDLIGRIRNQVSTTDYLQARRRLSEERITYDRESGLPEILDASQSANQFHLLTADLEEAEPFRLSFDELMDEFNQRAGKALETLDRVQLATESIYERLDRAGDLIADLERVGADLAELSRDDGIFSPPSLVENLLPRLRRDFDGVSGLATTDPIQACEEADATARLGNEAMTVLDALRRVRTTRLAEIREAAHRLRREISGGADTENAGLEVPHLSCPWIETTLGEISDRVEKAIGDGARAGAVSEIDPVKKIDDLAAKTQRALDLDTSRREVTVKAVLGARKGLASARAELAAALALEPDSVLAEKEADPGKLVAKSLEYHGKLSLALDDGELDRADWLSRGILHSTAEVNRIVAATLEAHASHKEKIRRLEEREAALRAELPPHRRILDELERSYSPAVLVPLEGDTDYPGANGTLADNLGEAQTVIDKALELRVEARRIFREGRILAAAARLDEARGRHSLADFRLEELRKKKEQVLETERWNAAALERLQQDLTAIDKLVDDRRTTHASRESHDRAQGELDAAVLLHRADRDNPFETRRAFEAIEQRLQELRAGIDADFAIYREAERSLEFARTSVSRAESEVRAARDDDLPDSPDLLAAGEAIQNLRGDLATLESNFLPDHSEWSDLDRQADAIGTEAAKRVSVLRREVELGRQAASELERARAEVRRMQGWLGSHGVVIAGSPGTAQFRRARARLDQGDYQQAILIAGNASRIARDAIAQAEARVERRRREEQRRRARARARRAAAISSILSSSSGSSSFSSGGSSFSSSSSGFSSSSSSSSSSSGFSSSSW